MKGSNGVCRGHRLSIKYCYVPGIPVYSKYWLRNIYCPECGNLGIWEQKGQGDYYHGPDQVCLACAWEGCCLTERNEDDAPRIPGPVVAALRQALSADRKEQP